MAGEDRLKLESLIYRAKPGRVIISNKDSDRSSSVVIDDDGVAIVSSNAACGVIVGDDGILIQGDVVMMGYGKSIKKSHFSENPKGAKIFTYTETIAAEAAIKEKLAEVVGQLGINTGELTKTGIVPLITNIGGIPPHLHTMMFQHVHRVEPQYIYRIPSYLTMFKDFMGFFTKFLSA